jgi:hypothetical protein
MSVVFETVRPVFENAGRVVDYPWDAWTSASYFMFVDEEFASIVEALSDTAQDALILATAEWICARHFREPRAAQVLQYIDAVWAAALAGAAVSYEDLPEEEWQGPVLGPLFMAQSIVVAQHFEAGHDNATAARASWTRNLVLHIIGKDQRPAFDRWTVAGLDTLKKHHPYERPRWNSIFDAEFSNTDKCPPDALSVPDRYDPEDLENYIARHVARVAASPYLGITGEAS